MPGLGDPNVNESNSLAIVNLENPSAPRVDAFVRTGLPFGKGSDGGSSPSGVIATAERIFVSNGTNDSITVIDAKTNQAIADVPIRIPGLENLRGVLPIGLAFHAASGWLLVAEAGANAVGVIDTKQMKLIGHLPVGWFPTRILIDGDQVYVTNAKGHGTGPNAGHRHDESFASTLRRGTVSSFPIPSAGELPSEEWRRTRAEGEQTCPRPRLGTRSTWDGPTRRSVPPDAAIHPEGPRARRAAGGRRAPPWPRPPARADRSGWPRQAPSAPPRMRMRGFSAVYEMSTSRLMRTYDDAVMSTTPCTTG